MFGKKKSKAQEIRELSSEIMKVYKPYELGVRLSALCVVLGSYVATNEIDLGTLTKSIKDSAKAMQKKKIKDIEEKQ